MPSDSLALRNETGTVTKMGTIFCLLPSEITSNMYNLLLDGDVTYLQLVWTWPEIVGNPRATP